MCILLYLCPSLPNNIHMQNNNWNLGEKERIGIKKRTEYTILVGVIQHDQSAEQVEEYLDELEFLAETAGAKKYSCC